MSNGFMDYVTDIWNSLDITRILSLYFYAILIIFDDNEVIDQEGQEGLKRYILVLITLLSWMRVVSYVRVYNSTRYMIRMIIEIF